MDFEKMLGILIFFAGISVILIGGGFAFLSLMNRARKQKVEWKRLDGMLDPTAELDELRARIEDLERRGLVSGEVEAQYAKLAEVEERLDFAERLLATRAPGRLEGGPS